MDGSNPSSPSHVVASSGPECFELSTGSSPHSESVASEAPEATPLPISFDIDGMKTPGRTRQMTPGRKRLEGYGSTKVLSPRIELSATPTSEAKGARAKEANAQKRERVERAKLEREAAAKAKSRTIESKCEAARLAKAKHEQREAEKKAKRQETWRSAAIAIHGEASVRAGAMNESVQSRSPGVTVRCMSSTDKGSSSFASTLRSEGSGFAPPPRSSSNIKTRPASPLASGGSRGIGLEMSIRSTCSRSPERIVPPQRLTQPVAPNLHSSQRATKSRGMPDRPANLTEKPEASRIPGGPKSESAKSPEKVSKGQRPGRELLMHYSLPGQSNAPIASQIIKDGSQHQQKND